MRRHPLAIGYVPLVDAAPLVIAQQIGFAEQEGVELELCAAPSWSTLRDLVALGQIDAAHMLAPVPVAAAIGLGGMTVRLDALCVLSVGGNAIGISNKLAQKMREHGHQFEFDDAAVAGHALMSAADRALRIGVPFPFSMHSELFSYWVEALRPDVSPSLEIRTVPPLLMSDALRSDEIDVFCVGAPWGSQAVDDGAGTLLLPTTAIWKGAPEKVLAARHDWIEANRDQSERLIRSMWRACRWLDERSNHVTASEILSRKEYLDQPAELLERSLSGNFTISHLGEQRTVPDFLRFHHGAANFPWRSQADWIACRLAARAGFDLEPARETARRVFRSDVYRAALSAVSADLPGASEKVEGALTAPTEVASQDGTLILRPDGFFDGRIFDPNGN